MAVDLQGYLDRILDETDKPLFEDAYKAALHGALRASYVMIWLSCAESLKRRFKEAQKRDATAGKIVGEIYKKENEHKAVDKFVIEKAYKYGFLSDSAYSILLHIYEMRCVYGHPYEEAPTEEQVTHAAAAVVKYVLSQPVKLRHGFASQLLKNLLEDKSYLDDQREAVQEFAEEILARIDDEIYGWVLKYYWRKLEEIADDSSLGVFFRRGLWFSTTLLRLTGTELFTEDQWHETVCQYPKVCLRIFSEPTLFSGIGRLAQDYLVGTILDRCESRPTVLCSLEKLCESKSLTTRQEERFFKKIESISISSLRSSGLTTSTCFARIIKALKSYNWYAQNPAVDLVLANGATGVSTLEMDQQNDLGRNILQAAKGNSGSAINFIEKVAENPNGWPKALLEGMVLECFVNEDKQIRFKTRHLNNILNALDQMGEDDRKCILNELISNINSGEIKYTWISKNDFEFVILVIETFDWADDLKKSLESKADSIFEKEVQDEN